MYAKNVREVKQPVASTDRAHAGRTPMVRHLASCTRASLAGSSLGICDTILPILTALGSRTDSCLG